jgi:chromosome partitioning protein
LIDTDPQASASDALGYNPVVHSGCGTLADWYRNPEPLSAEKHLFETKIGGLYLLPNSLDAMDCDVVIKNAGQPYGFIRKFLNSKPIQSRFDNVFIDTPPHLDEHYKNAVMAADFVLIPLVPDIKSIRGLVNLNRSLQSLAQDSTMRVLGIVLTRVERTRVHQDFSDWVREKYGSLVFNTDIEKAAVYQEVDRDSAISVISHSPSHKAAERLTELSLEIEERIASVGVGRRKKPHLWDRNFSKSFEELASSHSQAHDTQEA